MSRAITPADLLFEVRDVFDRKIRTTKGYWKKIREVKHTELRLGIAEIKKTLTNPDEVRRSVTDTTILLFTRNFPHHGILVVAVKVLNGEGFLVTCYQTKILQRKGKIVWPKLDQNQ